jgi:catechol 2,3-dioxygenase-like lactoylglutathione lyase family enzyme
MLSYVTIGTNDYERALQFYDSLFKALGGGRTFEAPTGQFYGFAEGSLFGVFKPANGQAATGGNGTMFSFKVASPAEVATVYAKAIESGATNEGEPGPRGDRGFYGSYVRDPDGNKLCIYHM